MDDARAEPGEAPFSLGYWRVDPAASSLEGPGGTVALEPKVMAVLVMLAGRPGEVVTRQAFIDTVWAREYGGDESLTRAVSLLRKALGAPETAGVRIETVPRKGYRLVVSGPSSWRRTALTARPIMLGILAALALLLLLRSWNDTETAQDRTASGDAHAIVAVLPFDSLSPIEEDRYLADGLADEILSALTRSGSVSVIAGNSSFRFRGDDKKDLPRLVRQLGVTHVVDGSVRRTGSELRVGVHLVDAGSGLVAWSTVLERPGDGAWQIPDQVAAAVLAALGEPGLQRPVRTQPGVPAAYDRLLQARALLRQDPFGNTDVSIRLLQEAVMLDPELAEAWALMALARLNIVMDRPSRATTGYRTRDPDARLATSRDDARRALALDSRSPEAMLALRVVDYRARLLPLTEAEESFQAVLDVAPRHPNATMRMGMLMVEMGRLEEALVYFRRAHELDPLSMQTGGFLINFSLQTGALKAAQALLESGNYPWFDPSFFNLEWTLDRRDIPAARAWLANARALGNFWSHGATSARQAELAQDPERLHALIERVIDVVEAGRPDSDPKLAAELIDAAEDGLILHFWVGPLLANSGFIDTTFEMILERLAVDDIFMRGALFRRAYHEIRMNPRVMAWFDEGTQLDYWLETNRWPDFCADPALPYDCREEALRFSSRQTSRQESPEHRKGGIHAQGAPLQGEIEPKLASGDNLRDRARILSAGDGGGAILSQTKKRLSRADQRVQAITCKEALMPRAQG